MGFRYSLNCYSVFTGGFPAKLSTITFLHDEPAKSRVKLDVILISVVNSRTSNFRVEVRAGGR